MTLLAYNVKLTLISVFNALLMLLYQVMLWNANAIKAIKLVLKYRSHAQYYLLVTLLAYNVKITLISVFSVLLMLLFQVMVYDVNVIKAIKLVLKYRSNAH